MLFRKPQKDIPVQNTPNTPRTPTVEIHTPPLVTQNSENLTPKIENTKFADVGEKRNSAKPTPVKGLQPPQLVSLHRSASSSHIVDESGVAEIKDRITKSNGDIEQSLVSDAQDVISSLKQSYEAVRDGCKRPCVMLAGITGAGKSSVINTVFGVNLAKVGVGSPVTVNFTRYEIPDTPVILYDAKGFECGENLSDISQETLDFVAKAKDHIHVVWYVINSASARFQPFEIDLCRQVYKNIPIVFILNKADISPKDARDSIRKCILDFNFPNTSGIFDVTADKSRLTMSANTVCPACGSPDINIRKKDGFLTCDACPYKGHIQVRTGLEDVVMRTCELLSENAVVSFISAQRISFEAKHKHSCTIIQQYHDWCTRGHSTDFKRPMTEMLGKLSVVWGFKGHGEKCASEVVHGLLAKLTFWSRVSIAFKRDNLMVLETVAVGIVWASSLRDLTTLLVAGSVFMDGRAEKDKMDQAMTAAFSNFNQDYIFRVAQKIMSNGLAPVLQDHLNAVK